MLHVGLSLKSISRCVRKSFCRFEHESAPPTLLYPIGRGIQSKTSLRHVQEERNEQTKQEFAIRVAATLRIIATLWQLDKMHFTCFPS